MLFQGIYTFSISFSRVTFGISFEGGLKNCDILSLTQQSRFQIFEFTNLWHVLVQEKRKIVSLDDLNRVKEYLDPISVYRKIGHAAENIINYLISA